VRRILLTVFALMVLLPSVAFARSEYLCRFDGQVRSSCCCPTRAQPHEAPRSTSLREACCCRVFEGAPSRAQPATEVNRGDSRSHLPAFVAAICAQVSVFSTSVSIVAPLPRSTAPPAFRKDLFVRHCALLL
jgi:hypothetical protein